LGLSGLGLPWPATACNSADALQDSTNEPGMSMKTKEWVKMSWAGTDVVLEPLRCANRAWHVGQTGPLTPTCLFGTSQTPKIGVCAIPGGMDVSCFSTNEPGMSMKTKGGAGRLIATVGSLPLFRSPALQLPTPDFRLPDSRQFGHEHATVIMLRCQSGGKEPPASSLSY